MKIAVTGPKGRLGSALVRTGAIPIYADITNIGQLEAEISTIDPDVIINCAAKSSVSWCEEHRKEAIAINYRGAVNVRQSFKKWIIQISTDWIFDGRFGPYSEKAQPSPLNAYGWSKWGAEIMLRAYKELPYTVVRTTILYDALTDNFATKVIRKLSNKEPFIVVPEVYGNPTYILHLVEALHNLIERNLSNVHLINISGTSWVSRESFARQVAEFFVPENIDLIQVGKPPEALERNRFPSKAGFELAMAKKLNIPLYSLTEGLEAYYASLA